MKSINSKFGLTVLFFYLFHILIPFGFTSDSVQAQTLSNNLTANSGSVSTTTEENIGATTVFSRALSGGPLVFFVLMLLVVFSILTWAILIAKWIYLNSVHKQSAKFIKVFWDSRSLNELNSKIGDYPYSPIREVFRSGYAELVKGSQLRDQAQSNQIVFSVAVDNLNRTLGKSRLIEKRRLERYLPLLAISASSAPFIGLFGTVWGIMGAFEGIARSGSSSLAAVAPGISEALIATAFGLAAAIPAVMGFNIFQHKIRDQVVFIEGFSADFLNIIERYLISDKSKGSGNSAIGSDDKKI